MTIWTELEPWTDEDWLVSPHRCYHGERWSSGNGIRYTSEAIIAAQASGQLASGNVMRFNMIVTECMVRPGLLMRGQTHKNIHGDGQSWDDYVAFASAVRSIVASMDVGSVAQSRAWTLLWQIWHRNQELGWYCNNLFPDAPNPGVMTLLWEKIKGDKRRTWAYLGRFPFIRATFTLALGYPTSLLSRMGLGISILMHSESDDGWAMTWHILHASEWGLRKDQWMGKLIRTWFMDRLTARGGAREFVFRGDKEHPVRQYFPLT